MIQQELVCVVLRTLFELALQKSEKSKYQDRQSKAAPCEAGTEVLKARTEIH